MSNETLDPLYAAVFEDTENGTPDNITQAGCLVLARLGKEAWNAWRLKYPVRGDKKNIANFQGINFENDLVNFAGFKFGNYADFQNAQFGKQTRFDYAVFGDCVIFNRSQFKGVEFFKATFGYRTEFQNVNFGFEATFQDAEFGNWTSFENSRFGDSAIFNGTKFGENTQFLGVAFGGVSEFCRVQFGCGTRFDGVQFNVWTQFDGSWFKGDTRFDGVQFGKTALFEGVTFDGNVSFIGIKWEMLAYAYYEIGIKAAKERAEERGLSPITFKSISFAGATFKGITDFSNRIFEEATSFARISGSIDALLGLRPEPVMVLDFLPNGKCIQKQLPVGHQVTFKKAPLFHNCKLHQDTTFDGAIFPEPSSDPTENDVAARAYRSLKLAFSQHQASYQEQLFFRLEMDEEAAKLSENYSYSFLEIVKIIFSVAFKFLLAFFESPFTILNWLLSSIKYLFSITCKLITILCKAKNNDHRTRILLFSTYKCFSDYGFSFYRPINFLVVSTLFFWGIYTALANTTICFSIDSSCQLNTELIQFTLLQSLPLPGLDKWSDTLRLCLFPTEGLKSVAFTIALMLHKAVSLLAVFLFGLALRNLFKMK
jgi:hypothetical protein